LTVVDEQCYIEVTILGASHKFRNRAFVFLGMGLAVGIVLGLWRPLTRFLSSGPRLRVWVRSFGPWAPMALIALYVAQIVIAPLPGQLVDTVGGYLFGPWRGTLYGLVGVLLGSSCAASLTRAFGRLLLRRMFSPERLKAWDGIPRVNSLSTWILILMLPFGDIGYFVAGFTTLPVAKLALAAVVSHIPSVFLASLIGSQMVHLPPSGVLSLLLVAALITLGLSLVGERLRTLWNQRMVGFLRELARRR